MFRKMFTENKVHAYENKIDLKRIITDYNLHEIEESVFVCDLNDLKTKYEMWQKYMPRVKPYYGEWIILMVLNNVVTFF